MSITRGENGTYTSQVRVKDWTGKTIHKKKRGFKRKKDAKEWERQMLSQGNILNTTLKDFFEIYLEDKKNVIKQRTVYNKRDVFRKHIFPYFADRPMNSFKAPELIQWQNKITSMGYKPTYLNDIHKHFQAVFTHACKVYDLAENPFDKMVRMGKPDADEMVFWTIDEYNAFIAQIEPGARYYVLFELLFWTGARIGDDDDKIRLNQRKPSKYKGLRRFGPEKNLQRINKFMKERPIFYKNLIQMKENIRFYLRCFYCITKVMILQFNSENRTELARNG